MTGDENRNKTINQPKFEFIPLSELSHHSLKEEEWVWEGYLAKGTLTCLSGVPKIGKTTFYSDLVYAIRAGHSFLGINTNCLVKCLILTEEGSRTFLPKFEWGIESKDDGVIILFRHKTPFTWKKIIKEIGQFIEKHNIELLIIDSLSEWSGLDGDKENQAGEILKIIRPLRILSDKGVAILLIHHSRKQLGSYPSERLRGSSALSAAFDILLEMAYGPADKRSIYVKSRFDGYPEKIYCQRDNNGYVSFNSTGNETGKSARIKQEKLLKNISTPMKIEEIMNIMGLKHSATYQLLNSLEREGKVEKSGAGRKGDSYRWKYIQNVSSTNPSIIIGDGRMEESSSLNSFIPPSPIIEEQSSEDTSKKKISGDKGGKE